MSEISNGFKSQKDSDISNPKIANIEKQIKEEQNVILDFSVYKRITKFEKCVCKIKLFKGNNLLIKTATGLFCHIPSKNLNVLITNYHIINKDFLEQEKELKIYIEYDEMQEEKIINLKTERLKYTDKILDATVIEILDEDLIDNFIEVDEEFINNKKFINETVFNLQFPKGKQLKASFGKIIELTDEGRQFKYDVGTEDGSSGSPIILANEYKIIGMHRGTLKTQNNNYTNYDTKENIGIYLDKIINSIPELSRTENKNIIKCLYDIKKEDVNQEIQVYDNGNNVEKT